MRIKHTAVFLILIFAPLGLSAQEGETVYIVEPSTEVRYPDAPPSPVPAVTPPAVVAQPKVPAGWHLQILTNAGNLEEAAALAEQHRGLFPGMGLYVIVSGTTFRLSVGPIIPSRLQAVLAAARGAGFTGAVLRRQN